MPVQLKPRSLLTGLRLAAGLGLITLADLVVLPAALVGLRRPWARVVAPPVARTLLRLFGVTVEVRGGLPSHDGQVVWISNHVSTLDPFVVVALGLPRTRYFLSGYLRAVLPFGLFAWLLGTFFTPPQAVRANRVRCFSRACDELRRTGESVYLTPEGMMVRTGQLGHFNKGAFHLATALGATIQPLYLEVPPALDPGTGFEVPGGGTVVVHVLPAIDARAWRLEDLEANRDAVRAAFVSLQDRLTSPATREDPCRPSRSGSRSSG